MNLTCLYKRFFPGDASQGQHSAIRDGYRPVLFFKCHTGHRESAGKMADSCEELDWSLSCFFLNMISFRCFHSYFFSVNFGKMAIFPAYIKPLQMVGNILRTQFQFFL